MRAAWVVLLAGVLALALAGGLALGLAGAPMLRAYLPAWLFVLAVPLGALPLVMGLELAGAGRTPLATALRRVLQALPLAALFVLPLLLHLPVLYGWADAALPGFAGRWLSSLLFTTREAGFLVVWAVLGVIFARQPLRRGRGLAVVGLLLHLVMGTLAGIDWAMSLQPGLVASGFGLLVIVSQCGAGLAAAVLLAAALGDATAVLAAARPMLALLGAWLFLQFSQYLIVWSADLPAEIVWYQQRDAGLGRAAEIMALAVCLGALFALLAHRLARHVLAVAAVAAAVLLLHLVEAWWLVTPAWRREFAIDGADLLLLLLGLGGLLGGGLLAVHRAGGRVARA